MGYRNDLRRARDEIKAAMKSPRGGVMYIGDGKEVRGAEVKAKMLELYSEATNLIRDNWQVVEAVAKAFLVGIDKAGELNPKRQNEIHEMTLYLLAGNSVDGWLTPKLNPPKREVRQARPVPTAPEPRQKKQRVQPVAPLPQAPELTPIEKRRAERIEWHKKNGTWKQPKRRGNLASVR